MTSNVAIDANAIFDQTNYTYKGKVRYGVYVRQLYMCTQITLFDGSEIELDPDEHDNVYQNAYLYIRDDFPGMVFLKGYNVMKNGVMREKAVKREMAFSGNYVINF